jgi:NADH-quinone oxidoreductase subunit L
MVTAGVYMMARSALLYTMAPEALGWVAFIGILTALFAASMALVATDIKRVLAYSTVSQLGYMVFAIGVQAYAAAIFHLVTHAFFKALLFLGAGAVIHALGGEQDMRRMGNLRRHLPTTHWTMFAATLAIAGIFPFAGFWSKDEILASAAKGNYVFYWFVAAFTAFLTAFYMFRLLYMTFYGESRVAPEVATHVHEAPDAMRVPLVLLAFLSLVGGMVLGLPPEHGVLHRWLAPVFAAAVQPHAFGVRDVALMLLSLGIAIYGWRWAYRGYIQEPQLPGQIAQRWWVTYRLLVNKYYIDEIYHALIVRPLYWLSERLLWNKVDIGIIDRLVNEVARVVRRDSEVLSRFQTGYVRTYAGILVAGAVIMFFVLVG